MDITDILINEFIKLLLHYLYPVAMLLNNVVFMPYDFTFEKYRTQSC